MKLTKTELISEIIEQINYEGITDYEISLSLQLMNITHKRISNILNYGNIEKALDIKLSKTETKLLHKLILDMEFEKASSIVSENEILVLEDIVKSQDDIHKIACIISDEFTIKEVSEIKYHSLKLIELTSKYEKQGFMTEQIIPKVMNIFKTRLSHYYGDQLKLI